jgi:hypothetical protein
MSDAELMFGARFAKHFVNKYLEKELPTRLVAYRNGWNLDDESLPDPLQYLTHEPIALDTWPSVITLVISTNEIARSDYSGNYDPIYRVQYSMRTYVWVRGDDADMATDMRDNLATVLRSAMLDNQCLKVEASTYPSGGVLIDEGTFREEFSDLTLLKGDRVMCGSYLAYDMTLNETVAREIIADSFDTDLMIGTILEISQE